MDVWPLEHSLAAPLEAFFRRVPESDHNSFAEDVLAPGLVQGWLEDRRARRAVAVEDGDTVVGYVAVLPLIGWSTHVGSLRASDAHMALRNARDVYTRRQEGVSIWVVPAAEIVASSPDEKDAFFDPAGDKVYRHPTFYEVPEGLTHL